MEEPPPSLPLIGKYGSDTASESSLPVPAEGRVTTGAAAGWSAVIGRAQSGDSASFGVSEFTKENNYQIITNKQLVYFDHLGCLRCVYQRYGRSSNRLLPLGNVASLWQ